MKCNYKWGTVNELVMLGILARINVSYINATDKDPSRWVNTDVLYNEHTLGIPSNQIFHSKSLIVLFDSINFSGSLLITMMQYIVWIDCLAICLHFDYPILLHAIFGTTNLRIGFEYLACIY